VSAEPRFEIVRTSAGWHARFCASNSRIVMSSEVYTRRRGALRAVELVAGTSITQTFGGDLEVDWQGQDLWRIEVREVDEREPTS
jgi:uncharacterized protein YegP (UPF0339 family)